ncbi:hypothetical protein CC85DRAFT_325349 [Cutaneotrichosporon oleaginosum]|uniref:Uncharacterized protein n=1 Tax=Cutaneotrichosporon oleaginosum TaxID=879819 RepID=A0A0J0XX17_9TREE|nr:uncharacterized protein CC85DRAFT_325349 [Cutaneotrichosporon oleaginosum]KLT45612.1 hypothetical protein CC85DRAFT_325349 [Cutaneotrichosporon oleaginosum]TXT04592.1 hypothetical protein COLE_07411 [Cutaneotrichosporon oleaginosum]
MDAAFFLKKKAKPNAIRGRVPLPPASSTGRPPATVARPPPRPKAPLPPRKIGLQAEPPRVPTTNGENILKFDIVSAAPGQKLRFNIMKLNSTKEVDPGALPAPIMMNRKQPGPKNLPQLAIDNEGKVIGRYVFDDEGNPVLDEEGKPTIEKKVEMDMSLVGSAPGTNNKRRGKRQTKEVFHQDVEVIKLRREEANPWVLESKNKTPESAETAAHIPEHWVGRMVEQAALPTVLLINDGTEANFTMIPLGRTYKFEPERPFKVMDADQAHKYFEKQAKGGGQDRWSQRQEGPGGAYVVKTERHALEDRANRMEWKIMQKKGKAPSANVKRERFEDDYVREGRNLGRGLEGGVDEELDYNADEDFQDDDDVDTFYKDGDDEEKQLQEERQKKEYRMANYTFGDRKDEDDDDDDDLFGDKQKLSKDGKRLRRLQRKQAHGEDADMYESSDDDTESSDEDEDKDKDKEKDKERRPPGSAEKSHPGSRSGSRPPDGRSGSPAPRLHPPGQRPGAGSALLAKRAASRGVSPRPPGAPGSSRAGSPLARGSSPVAREGSPAVRAGSPAVPRGSSPLPGTREGTPNHVKPGKRKATASPLDPSAPARPASRPPKRRSEESDASPAAKKKHKSGSATPMIDPNERFEGMIERKPVLEWLQSLSGPITMKQAAGQWGKHMKSYPAEKARNQKRLAAFIKEFADTVPTDPPTFDAAGKPERMIIIKDKYRA